MIKITNLTKEKPSILRPVSKGDMVEGEIISFGRSSVFIDLGPQGTGIIFGREFYEVKSAFKNLKIGSKITGEVVSIEDEEGYREISIKRAIYKKVWDNLRGIKEKGETLEVKVFGANRGGLLTKIHDISAFIPASQLSTDHFPRVENADKTKILSKLEELVSQILKVKILDINPKEEKIILSEKLEELGKTREALNQYQVGDIVEGEISGLADFGAFIAFGPQRLEGLIHVSELDWGLVKNPAEVVKVGEKIKVKIIDISHNRVSLSLKALKKHSIKEEKPSIKGKDSVVKEKESVVKGKESVVREKKSVVKGKEPVVKVKKSIIKKKDLPVEKKKSSVEKKKSTTKKKKPIVKKKKVETKKKKSVTKTKKATKKNE